MSAFHPPPITCVGAKQSSFGQRVPAASTGTGGSPGPGPPPGIHPTLRFLDPGLPQAPCKRLLQKEGGPCSSGSVQPKRPRGMNPAFIGLYSRTRLR